MSNLRKVGIVGVGPCMPGRSFGKTQRIFPNGKDYDPCSAKGEILGTVGDICCFVELRIDTQPMNERFGQIEHLRNDPHSSYYIPPYFAIFGSDRPLMDKRPALPKSKVSKNMRPKGTHTHRRIYR